MSDTAAGLLQVGLLLAALAACYRPLGAYMARVYASEHDSRVERVHLPGDGRRPEGRPALAGVRPVAARVLRGQRAGALRCSSGSSRTCR